MRVQVRLFATRRTAFPAGHPGATLTVALERDATAADPTARLGSPAAQARLLVLGGALVPFATPLADGQEINGFPPLAGGA